jgi:ribosomal protein S18 acetylase RimI-like enzyme
MAAPALRLGEASDAATIAAVATHVFLDTYAAAGVRPDLAREVFELCSESAFAAALAEPQRRFVLATTGAGVVGFAELVLSERPADVDGVSGAELVRLYVQPQARGGGVGRALVEQSEGLVVAASLRSLWLTVWDLNEGAIGFYRRVGFRDAGASRYTWEDQVYGTRIFAKELADVEQG